MYYFAYASNMYEPQMLERCPHSTFVATAYIPDYQLAITGYSKRWGGGGATIVPAPGTEVWGVVYEVDEHCLKKLDKIEGVPAGIYTRQIKTCHFANGVEQDVATYIRDTREFTRASDSYRDTIIKGAQEVDLPEAYLATLREILR